MRRMARESRRASPASRCPSCRLSLRDSAPFRCCAGIARLDFLADDNEVIEGAEAREGEGAWREGRRGRRGREREGGRREDIKAHPLFQTLKMLVNPEQPPRRAQNNGPKDRRSPRRTTPRKRPHIPAFGGMAKDGYHRTREPRLRRQSTTPPLLFYYICRPNASP